MVFKQMDKIHGEQFRVITEKHKASLDAKKNTGEVTLEVPTFTQTNSTPERPISGVEHDVDLGSPITTSTGQITEPASQSGNAVSTQISSGEYYTACIRMLQIV